MQQSRANLLVYANTDTAFEAKKGCTLHSSYNNHLKIKECSSLGLLSVFFRQHAEPHYKKETLQVFSESAAVGFEFCDWLSSFLSVQESTVLTVWRLREQKYRFQVSCKGIFLLIFPQNNSRRC